jgi:hypothetical protein
MKMTCTLSLALLAVSFVFGILVPTKAISGTVSVRSQGQIQLVPSHAALAETAPSESPAGELGNPNVTSPLATVGGKSYAEWSAAWWQWTMSHPFSQFFDPTGQLFSLDQSGPVWFLQGALETPERRCVMPPGTHLLCPIVLYLNDYPCPDPTFQPAPGQSMEDFLTAGAKAVIDGIPTSPFPLSLEVDGVAVNNLASYRTTSKLFSFTADLSMLAFDGCVTGTPQVGVSDGYLVILEPLPPGEHTLHFSGFGDVLVHLTVSGNRGHGRNVVDASTQESSWSLIKNLYRQETE